MWHRIWPETPAGDRFIAGYLMYVLVVDVFDLVLGNIYSSVSAG